MSVKNQRNKTNVFLAIDHIISAEMQTQFLLNSQKPVPHLVEQPTATAFAVIE